MRSNVGILADAAELLDGGEGAERGVVFKYDVSRECGGICKHGMGADLAIVCDVRVSHNQIVAAEPSDAAALRGAAVNGAELVKFVRVADFERDALPLVSQVLRVAANRTEGREMIIASQARGAL